MNEECAALDAIEQLNEAALRFSEPKVKLAYEQVVRVLEGYGDGDLYDGEPLNQTQLVLLASMLPELLPGDMPSELYTAHRILFRALHPLKPAWERPAEPAYMPQSTEITSINIGEINNSTVNITGSTRTNHVTYQMGYAFEDTLEEPQKAYPELESEINLAHDVFMSYAHKDGATMRRIAAKLRAAELRVWTDESLKPGTSSWVKAIEEAIQTSLVVAVVLTPNALQSEFANKEILTAQAYGTLIVPLLCKGDDRYVVPLTLRGVQWLDCRTEGEYRKSIIRLITHIHNLQKNTIR